jgi:hypothetical protein
MNIQIKKNWGWILTGLGVLTVVLTVLWWCFCVTFVDNYELGFTYNKWTGKIEKVDRTGYVFYNPIGTSVHSIDLRPIQVKVEANGRVLNTKLVRFNPEGLDKFVEWHGRDAADAGVAKPSNLMEILKSYAFNVNNGSDCPFLLILDEVGTKAPPSTGKVEK